MRVRRVCGSGKRAHFVHEQKDTGRSHGAGDMATVRVSQKVVHCHPFPVPTVGTVGTCIPVISAEMVEKSVVCVHETTISALIPGRNVTFKMVAKLYA